MPFFIDFDGVPDQHCTHCLDALHKALAEDPRGEGDRGIWKPHENPYLTWLVEDWSARMSALVAKIQDDFAKLLTGAPIGTLAKAAIPGLTWGPETFERVRLILETLPQDQWTVDDYMLAADYIIQRYLPEGVIRTEADYLTVRSALLGKIQASMELVPHRRAAMEAEQMEALTKLLPTSFRKVPVGILAPVERKMLEMARASCAEHISDVTEEQRHRMHRLCIEHVQAMILGQKDAGTTERLRTRIADEFMMLNRDFRRIAVTETGNAQNMGVIAAQPVGGYVRRLEAYRGACDWCASINGLVFKVVDPADPEKNGDKEVWVGKSNVGRSASPRKRVGDQLVEREAHERWWVAAGVQHPHCRGTWQPAAPPPPPPGAPPPAPPGGGGVDPAFAAWLAQQLEATRPKPPSS